MSMMGNELSTKIVRNYFEFPNLTFTTTKLKTYSCDNIISTVAGIIRKMSAVTW